MKVKIEIDVIDYNNNTTEYVENKIEELTLKFVNELAIRFVIDANFKIDKP